jgi:hypothetical protein
MRIQKFDFSNDASKAILWGQSQSTILKGLIQKQAEWFDLNHTQFWDNWYRDVFNLETANDFGLRVWCIILDLPLFDRNLNQDVWGFGDSRKNFNHGNFKKSGSGIILTLEQIRMLLQLRYWQLVTRCSVPQDNAQLKRILFDELGDVYILDGLNMSIVVIFQLTPPPEVLQVIKDYDLIPRSCAVKIKYKSMEKKSWGFGPNRFNFNNGNFTGSEI